MKLIYSPWQKIVVQNQLQVRHLLWYLLLTDPLSQVLYSLHSETCMISPAYENPVLDVFTTQTLNASWSVFVPPPTQLLLNSLIPLGTLNTNLASSDHPARHITDTSMPRC